MNHKRTKDILKHFTNSKIVEIEHYKDVFCRSGQNYNIQHKSQKMILAAKTGELVYEGAPVCQSFGNENFYYTSCMMNCVYDCEYCYLKGMYPSGNIVIFVNIEDIFKRIEELLDKHSMYVCVSYDTDMLALETITGYTEMWEEFASKHNNLKLEVRTKCANKVLFERLKPLESIVYAFTISPQAVIEQYEHGTPSLTMRIECAAKALQAGFKVRLCFDPMIYCTDWQKEYEEMLQTVFDRIDMNELEDVSVGTFRVSQDFLKKMRKDAPESAVVQFPYQNDAGVYHYPDELLMKMEQFMVSMLSRKIPQERIFLWKEQAN